MNLKIERGRGRGPEGVREEPRGDRVPLRPRLKVKREVSLGCGKGCVPYLSESIFLENWLGTRKPLGSSWKGRLRCHHQRSWSPGCL